MPKHRGMFDNMKPARISLDNPEEWRETDFMQSSPLLIRHTLSSAPKHPSTILETSN